MRQIKLAPPLPMIKKPIFRDFLCRIRGVFAPVRCVSCGRFDYALCRSCVNALRSECNRGTIISSLPRAPSIPVFSALIYGAPYKNILISLKHADSPQFAKTLSLLLSSTLYAARLWLSLTATYSAPAATDFVAVPMVSNPAKQRERGFHHLRLLLQRERKENIFYKALRADKKRLSQAELDATTRQSNARLLTVNATATARLLNKRVILVDDVCTSGATLAAAAESLAAQGVRVCAAVTVFRAKYDGG